MGLRAYLLVDVVDNMGPADFAKAVQELEAIPEVDLVNPVIGSHDIVVMVDTSTTVEAVASQIQHQGWVKNMEILRIESLSERHRTSP